MQAEAPLPALVATAPADLGRRALGYLPGLDGLRAVAVLLVMGYHARLPGFARGDLGVDVFFVLSGFLITSLIVTERLNTGAFSVRAFYTRRFVRLFPAYFLVLLACLAVTGLRHYGGTARGAVLSFCYVANWGAAYGQGLGLLRHTWSLSIEEQFYLAWPAVLLLLVRLLFARSVPLRTSVLALLLASYASAVLLLLGGVSLTWVQNATPTRVALLLAGALPAVVLGGRPERGSGRLDLLGCAALVLLLAVVMFPPAAGWNLVDVLWPVVAVTTVLVTAAVVLAPAGRLSRVLSVAPMTWLGKRSYGIYLWHYPILSALDIELGLGGSQIALGCGLTLLLAALSYRFVEQPLIAASRRRRRAAAPVA